MAAESTIGPAEVGGFGPSVRRNIAAREIPIKCWKNIWLPVQRAAPIDNPGSPPDCDANDAGGCETRARGSCMARPAAAGPRTARITHQSLERGLRLLEAVASH